MVWGAHVTFGFVPPRGQEPECAFHSLTELSADKCERHFTRRSHRVTLRARHSFLQCRCTLGPALFSALRASRFLVRLPLQRHLEAGGQREAAVACPQGSVLLHHGAGPGRSEVQRPGSCWRGLCGELLCLQGRGPGPLAGGTKCERAPVAEVNTPGSAFLPRGF